MCDLIHPLWSQETPAPGRVSYLLCSLIKNLEEEDPPRRICTRCFEGGLLPLGSWLGNIVNRKTPRGGGFSLRSTCVTEVSHNLATDKLFRNSGSSNRKFWRDMKLGPKTHVGATSQSVVCGNRIIPTKTAKMATIFARRRGGTCGWVPVATWCSEWILVHWVNFGAVSEFWCSESTVALWCREWDLTTWCSEWQLGEVSESVDNFVAVRESWCSESSSFFMPGCSEDGILSIQHFSDKAPKERAGCSVSQLFPSARWHYVVHRQYCKMTDYVPHSPNFGILQFLLFGDTVFLVYIRNANHLNEMICVRVKWISEFPFQWLADDSC